MFPSALLCTASFLVLGQKCRWAYLLICGDRLFSCKYSIVFTILPLFLNQLLWIAQLRSSCDTILTLSMTIVCIFENTLNAECERSYNGWNSNTSINGQYNNPSVSDSSRVISFPNLVAGSMLKRVRNISALSPTHAGWVKSPRRDFPVDIISAIEPVAARLPPR